MNGTKIGFSLKGWTDHGGWLYAFVVDNEVKYIGLTDGVLRTRLDHYRYSRESQNARLRDHIIAELSASRRVQVFGWRQRDKSILVSTEIELIAKHRPAWNRMLR